MSYCVNCGVELNPAARECPLCRTPVLNPSCPVDADAPSFFPTRRCSLLVSAVLVLLALGLFAVLTEFLCDRYLKGVWLPGWSMVVLASCVGLSIPLIIVRRVPSLREEARRRFHM